MSQENKPTNQTKIEYEGQFYNIDANIINSLDEQQILDLLAPSFPGMAGGKLERNEDGSIKIIKRVGTKGNCELLKLFKTCPEDNLSLKINQLNQKLSKQKITLGEWEQACGEMGIEKLKQILELRRQTTLYVVRCLYYCPSNLVPFI
ncbi:hypothetical protein NIES4102_40720 (plasmid) [Chondrocystis sp. NIES-4102]|nr:hypothetical protein NIES4102_40720 [Chondrocystis sp. NIES-4102]